MRRRLEMHASEHALARTGVKLLTPRHGQTRFGEALRVKGLHEGAALVLRKERPNLETAWQRGGDQLHGDRSEVHAEELFEPTGNVVQLLLTKRRKRPQP